MYESNRLYQKEMQTAEVVFQYPIASRIYLRQDKHDPWADTYVIVESLMHSDGERVNDSMDHRWAIHELPPHSTDFYNWQNRCISTGPVSFSRKLRSEFIFQKPYFNSYASIDLEPV